MIRMLGRSANATVGINSASNKVKRFKMVRALLFVNHIAVAPIGGHLGNFAFVVKVHHV